MVDSSRARDEPLDGNVLAGPFGELFAIDVTSAATVCAGCGRKASVAELDVYMGAGAVARCRGCHSTVARLVRTPTHVLLDLRGTVSLAVSLPAAVVVSPEPPRGAG
jgi:hypothetical protein